MTLYTPDDDGHPRVELAQQVVLALLDTRATGVVPGGGLVEHKEHLWKLVAVAEVLTLGALTR